MAKPTQMFAAYGLPCVTRGETSTGRSNLDTEVRARPGRERREKERKAKRIRRKDLIVKEKKTGRNKNSLRTARIFVSQTRSRRSDSMDGAKEAKRSEQEKSFLLPLFSSSSHYAPRSTLSTPGTGYCFAD